MNGHGRHVTPGIATHATWVFSYGFSDVLQFQSMLSHLTCTRDNERGPQYMEHVFALLHGVIASRQHIRLIYTHHDGKVGLYLDHPNEMRKTVEKQILGQYPTAVLKPIEDSLLGQAEDRVFWHRRMTLRPDLFPIKRYSQYEDATQRELSDPLTAIFEALNSEPSDGLRPSIEISIRPASRRRARQARRAVQRLAEPCFRHNPDRSRRFARGITHRWWIVRFATRLWSLRVAQQKSIAKIADVATSSARSHEREDDLTAASDKLGGFLYSTTLRVTVAGSPTKHKCAKRKLDELCGVVSATSIPRLARFCRSMRKRSKKFPSSVRGRPFLLSAKELATLFHPPTSNVAAENLSTSDTRRAEPPKNVAIASKEKDAVPLGRIVYRDRHDVIGLLPEDRLRHVYAIGRTGMGKSTLIENMIVHDIHAGRGVGLLDPHGDLYDHVLRSVPRTHWNRVVLFDPADTAHPVALNPLDCSDLDASQRALVAGNLLTVFKRLYAESFQAAARMEDIIRNAFLALVEMPDATLLSVSRLLTDDTYRNAVTARVENPVVRHFWIERFPSWSRRYRGEAIAPVENKIRGLISNPFLQTILGQPRSKINLRQIMDDGRILLVRLGGCGEDAAALLGALLVTAIQQAVMTRADLSEPDRRDFYLYADEFQRFDTPAIQTLLSESRKMRLSLMLSHQYLDQIEEPTRQAIFGNAGTYIAFGLGNDAQDILPLFGDHLVPSDLIQLPKYHAYTAAMVDDKTSNPFLIHTLKPRRSLMSLSKMQTVIDLSRRKHTSPAVRVHQQLQDLLASV